MTDTIVAGSAHNIARVRELLPGALEFVYAARENGWKTGGAVQVLHAVEGICAALEAVDAALEKAEAERDELRAELARIEERSAQYGLRHFTPAELWEAHRTTAAIARDALEGTR